MAQIFERASSAGFRMAGVCVPGWGINKGTSLSVDGHTVPVLGDEEAVAEAVESTGADMVGSATRSISVRMACGPSPGS